MKYVLVTGAYGGMGRKTVARLVEQGFGVFALDQNIGEPTKRVIPVQVDTTDEQSVAAAFRTVQSITSELFAVVHFAGIYQLDSLVEIASRDFARAFEVNVFGAALVNRTFFPLLKSGSRIVIVTSELATNAPLPFTGLYAVTKGVLDRYAYSLRMELQLLGISVSVIRAGAVDTGMLGVSTKALDAFCENTRLYSCNAKRFRKIVDSVEAKRVPPDRIAALTQRILCAKHPRFAFSLNRNPLLVLFNVLPARLQFWSIRQVLK